jgi:hypothetical protein
VGETRVDLQHLLEDLRDAYSGSLEHTILTEIVANALDSGATTIRITTNPADATLTVVDDGRGMKRRELARYHDVAASAKARGEGIGFAGVGIKLGLLVSREVVTETRRGATHVATRWHLASKHRAPWKWIPPPNFATARGTAVQLALENPLSPLLDGSYLEEAVRQHFETLFDPGFDDLLRRHYPQGIAFEIDGRPLARTDAVHGERGEVAIRLGRRRTPSVLGFLERHDGAMSEDRQGVAVSTFGKVIKRGWDWLGLTPAAPGRISGLIEAPELAACLTLSKSDFIRTGPRGATYLAYRKAIQEVVSRQLAAWGDTRDAEAKPRTQRLERDLARVLEDLSDDFPLLRSLVDRRAGGQKRLPMPGRGKERVPGPRLSQLADVEDVTPAEYPHAERGSVEPNPTGPNPVEPHAVEPHPVEPAPPEPTTSAPLSTVSGRRRPARYGLLVQFESRGDDVELARLVDSTIWVNDAHPAYVRATASRSAGYHLALSVALALAPLAVEDGGEHAFITRFLSHWGGAPPSRPIRTRRA